MPVSTDTNPHPYCNIILTSILGAMWIRRSFGNDPLYHTVVQAYIDTLLQQGFNFECFIEGGRSRTGKLLSPKFGILNFIVESVLSGRVNDTIICPVSTQYDKVIETEYGYRCTISAELNTDPV
jgi:glycerol-3-phosphate O-acyltransferase